MRKNWRLRSPLAAMKVNDRQQGVTRYKVGVCDLVPSATSEGRKRVWEVQVAKHTLPKQMSRPLYAPHGLAIFLRLLHFLLCLNLNVFFNILGHEVFIDYHEINDITSKKHFFSFVTLNKGDDTSKGKSSP